jgi:ABC-type phosphate/phosphonate transport system ATPase subunit
MMMEPGLDEEQAVSSEAPALEMSDVWFGYTRDRPALKGVSLIVPPGEVTMILGVSGGGKTTLLKLAKGFLAPQRGSVTVLGRRVSSRLGARRLDPRVAFIPQHLGLVRQVEARQTLESLGIAHKSGERVSDLSGGERQRVAIARAMMQRPQLLLADESVSHLDPVTGAEIMGLFCATARSGVTVVMTTHQLELASRYADRAVVLRNGEKAMDCLIADTNEEDLRRVMKL